MIRTAAFIAALVASTAMAGASTIYGLSEADCNEYALSGFPHEDGVVVDGTYFVTAEMLCVLPHEPDGTEMAAVCDDPSLTENHVETMHLASDEDTLTLNGDLVLRKCESREH